MRNKDVSLSKRGHDIIIGFEKSKELTSSELIEFSLLLFDFLYRKKPKMLDVLLNSVMDEIEK